LSGFAKGGARSGRLYPVGSASQEADCGQGGEAEGEVADGALGIAALVVQL